MRFGSLSFLLTLVASATVVLCVHNSAIAQEPVVAFDTSVEGRISIHIGDQPVAVYVYQDDAISRPYFAHLRAPGAPQVSRNHPPIPGKDRDDHGTYHPGLWMAFGDMSGNDYWRLAAAVKHVRTDPPPTGGAGRGTFTAINHYLDQHDSSETLCEETCQLSFVSRPAGYLLLWDSTFSSDRVFDFGDQEEMGLGIRVATPIRVEQKSKGGEPAGNGKMIDSEGRDGGDEIWGNTADWCDYSGTIDGQHVGMTLFCHPGNFRPSWFHARDYGLLLANPFGRDAFGKGAKSTVTIQPGDRFRLRYGVYVHATPVGQDLDLPSEYAFYLRATAQ